jgi:hypothetical protein
MSRLLTRRAFGAGLAVSIPAVLLGRTAASQSAFSVHDPNGTGLDLESVFLRVSPHHLRDLLMAMPFEGMVDGDRFEAERWVDIGQSPYFSSVGGVNIVRAGGGDVLGAYGIYLAPAGARAGQYLGRRALEDATLDIVESEVAGYPAEILMYDDGAAHEVAQVPVGNVMVLGYDLGGEAASSAEHPSLANADILITHLRQIFELTR